MSTSTELSRLLNARNTIRTKLVDLGLAQPSDKLDTCANAISTIEKHSKISAKIVEGESYTIPKGYHDGSGTVSGTSGGGSYELQDKIVTPTKQQQSVTPDTGYFGLGSVTVAAIPEYLHDVRDVNAEAEQVLSGRVYVKSDGSVTTGTMSNNGTVDKTLDTVNGSSYTIPKGYHSGTGTVKIVPETKTVTPTESAQEITPTEGKVLSKVTVARIPTDYVVTTDADAIASEILVDKSAYVKGVKVTGTMPDNGAMNKSMDGLATTSVTIPAGYTSGGTVNLTSAIEEALAAI